MLFRVPSSRTWLLGSEVWLDDVTLCVASIFGAVRAGCVSQILRANWEENHEIDDWSIINDQNIGDQKEG